MDFDLHMRNSRLYVRPQKYIYSMSVTYKKVKIILQATGFGCSSESKSGLIQEQWILNTSTMHLLMLRFGQKRSLLQRSGLKFHLGTDFKYPQPK